MADMNPDDAMFTTIQNVPTFMVENAIEWHNKVTGDEWNLTYEKHPDIQHRIGQLIDMCDEYEVVNYKVIYTEADLF